MTGSRSLAWSLVPVLAIAASAWATQPPVVGFEPEPEVLRDLAAMRAEPVRHGLVNRALTAKANREALARGDKAFGGTVVQGTVAAPVLTAVFSNVGAPYAVANLQQMLFDGPWPTGTMTEYYDEISYGLLDVPGTVYDWVQLPQTDAYYAGTGNGLNCTGRVWQLLQQSIAANDGAVDFAQYDNDGPDNVPNSGDDDGFVDFVAFVHPETGGECGGNNNIWSHRFSLTGWGGCGGGIGPFTTNDASANGGNIRIDDYTIQPARSCFGGGQIEIGVFAHEFGHAFGLPDLYDVDGPGQGIGNWGLMGSGSYGGDDVSPDRPTHMCAWSKEYLGWVTPDVIAWSEYSGIIGYQLLDAEENPSAVRITFPPAAGAAEYFLLEVRRPVGFDDSLVQGGLLIWHIDDAKWTPGGPNTANVQACIDGPVLGPCGANHPTVALEQADGQFHLELGVNRADAGDPFPPTVGVAMRNTTTPWSYDYNRVNPNAYWLIQNIQDDGFVPNAMRFTVTKPVSCGTVASGPRMGGAIYAVLFVVPLIATTARRLLRRTA